MEAQLVQTARMVGSRDMARPMLDFATLAVGTSGEREGSHEA
jgi:hypothetical protein